MRSVNVVLDKPKDVTINKNTFIQKYFQMLPLKMDPYFGLYKVKLFQKNNDGNPIDVFDSSLNNTNIDNQCSISNKSPVLFSITEINVGI